MSATGAEQRWPMAAYVNSALRSLGRGGMTLSGFHGNHAAKIAARQYQDGQLWRSCPQ
jgi:hypothetical protein